MSLGFSKTEIEGSIPSRFQLIAQRYSDHLAIKDGSRSLSYTELDVAANRIANELLALNGEKQETVGLLFGLSAEAIIAHLAVLKAGKVCVALDPDFPPERLKLIASHAGITSILTGESNLTIAGLLNTQNLICTDSLSPSTSTEDPGQTIYPDDIASLVYTSGSTGIPKGVIHTHRSLMHRAWSDTCFHQLRSNDRQSALMSLAFGASFPNVMAALLNGAAVFPFDPRRRDFRQLLTWLRDEEITVFHPPVAAFRQLLKICSNTDRFPSCRIVVQGGEPLLAADANLFHQHFDDDCLLIHELASTEAQVISRYVVYPDMKDKGETEAVGFPDPDKELLLLDENDREVGTGRIGELVVRSKYISPGYWCATPEQVSSLKESDDTVTFRTGDMVSRRVDNALIFHGRCDLVTKLRGYRIDLTEVEATVARCDQVSEAAVCVRQMSANQRQLVAYVVPAQPVNLTVDGLRAELNPQLPDYMVPTRFVWLEELPRTAGGKIDRQALPHPENTRPMLSEQPQSPSSEVESRFMEIWCEVLGIESIGVNDSFFDLGGDSLSAVHLVEETETCIGRHVSMADLFQAPTIAGITKSITRDRSPINSVALGPRTPQNLRRLPLFCIFGLSLYKELADEIGKDHRVIGIYVPAEIEVLKGSNKGRWWRHVIRGNPRFPSVEELAAQYVQQIKSVQPFGPYQLLGSSFGGVVAFEMARQLQASGDSVHFLALLDSYAPGSRRPNSLRGWLAEKYHRLAELLPKRAPTKNSSDEEWESYRGRIRSCAFRRYHPSPVATDAILVLAQQADQFPGFEVNSQYGWGSLVSGEMKVKKVPGDHLGILRRPNVTTLAESLIPYLDREDNYSA